jgi:phosphonate transport system permease protein
MSALSVKILAIISTALFVLFYISLDLDIQKFFYGINNFFAIVNDSASLDGSVIKVALTGIYETIKIAYTGTFIGAILSFPFAVLASRNFFSSPITTFFKTLLAAIRTLPALLWAILFVMIVGLGPLAGVLATIMYTIGYLSKLFSEVIEGADPESIDALKGIGASKLQLIQYTLLPQVANGLISQVVFIFEYNVRSSTILGFVGAGGIGFYISAYLKLLQYDKVATIIIIVFLLVLMLEFLSMKFRDNFLIKNR